MQPQEKKEINWRGWVLGTAVVVVLVIALQNSQEVTVQVLTASFNAPLIVMLLIFTALGALIGWAAPVLLRHRRSERVRAKELKEKK